MIEGKVGEIKFFFPGVKVFLDFGDFGGSVDEGFEAWFDGFDGFAEFVVLVFVGEGLIARCG